MGVLSDDDLVRMRARARHRLFGALALVVLMVVGVPLLFDRHGASPPASSDDSDADHSADAAKSPQPATVSAPGTGGAGQEAAGAASSESAAGPAASGATAGPVQAPGSAAVAGTPAARSPEPGSPQVVPDTIPPMPVTAPGKHGERGAANGRESAAKSVAGFSAEGAAKANAAKDAAVREASAREAATRGAGASAGAAKAGAARDSAGKDSAGRDSPAKDPAAREPSGKDSSPNEAPGKESGEKGADSGTPAAPHGWFVQFGMFAEPPRAQALSERLEAQGIHVHDEVVQGPRGRFTLVRAGPFSSRNAADELLARARGLGENAFLGHQ